MEVLKKVTLRSDRAYSNGEREIRIRLTLYEEQKFFSIGYKATPDEWDYATEEPKVSHPQYKKITRAIEDYLEEIDFEIRFMKKNGHEYISLADLIAKVKKKDQPVVAAKLYAFTDSIIKGLKSEDRIGYSNTFRDVKDYDHVQKQVDFLDKSITEIITEHYAQAFECLDSISGIGVKSAEIIISEAGKDMSRFPTADHFTAWCGIAPGNNESTGKRKNTSIKKGNSYLRVAIVGAAWAAVRMKDSYWHALFDKLRKCMKAQRLSLLLQEDYSKWCIIH